MADKWRIAKATAAVLETLGYTWDAVADFRAGKHREGFAHMVGAAGTIATSWDDLEYTWSLLSESTANALQASNQQARSIAETRPSAAGHFTGSWISSDKRQTELIYHEASNNALALYTPSLTQVSTRSIKVE